MAPTGFEVLMIEDLAGRFSGRRTFIEDLEKVIPEFYEKVGQHLRRWNPSPPPIDKAESIRNPISDPVSSGEDQGDVDVEREAGHASSSPRTSPPTTEH